MKSILIAAALVAVAGVPIAVDGQASSPMPPAPQMQRRHLTDEQRAAMDNVMADAKTATYAALTPAHRDAVMSIVAQVSSGKLDPRSAGKQIDDLLTGGERASIATQAESVRKAMRAAMGAPDGPPPGGMAANAPPPGPGGAPEGSGRYAESPGRFIMMVSISREQMRALRHDRANVDAR